MLNNMSSLITPDIYGIIYSMGHMDELTIVDANFSDQKINRENRVFMPISDNSLLLAEILKYFPLDEDEKDPVIVFIPDYEDTETPSSWGDYQQIVDDIYGNGRIAIKPLPRDLFYARAIASYATIKTLDKRVYANIIIRKGFVLSR